MSEQTDKTQIIEKLVEEKRSDVKSHLYLPSQGGFDNSFSTITITGGLFFGKRVDEMGDLLIGDSDLPKFHIGQSYEEEPAQALKCEICSGTQFYVGQGSWYTAIKCVHCEWELCIHEG